MTRPLRLVPRLSDADADQELYAAIAAALPELITTVSALMAELADVDLEPGLLRGLGVRVQRLGHTLVMRADRASNTATGGP